MKSNYELIKDYLVQKGYEGPNLEQAAWQATVKIEAIRTGIDPLLTTPVPAPVDATGGIRITDSVARRQNDKLRHGGENQ